MSQIKDLSFIISSNLMKFEQLINLEIQEMKTKSKLSKSKKNEQIDHFKRDLMTHFNNFFLEIAENQQDSDDNKIIYIFSEIIKIYLGYCTDNKFLRKIPLGFFQNLFQKNIVYSCIYTENLLIFLKKKALKDQFVVDWIDIDQLKNYYNNLVQNERRNNSYFKSYLMYFFHLKDNKFAIEKV